MGLDIYLYTAAAHEQNERHTRERDEIWERKERGELTEDEARAAWSQIAGHEPHTDVVSQKHGEHLFNRRYLRSNYNGAGFNSTVTDFLGNGDEGSLYWIFQPMGREWNGDEGALTEVDIPKLEESKARALDVAERLGKVDPLRVDTVSCLGPAMTGEEFLAWYRQEQAGRRAFDSYSCREGTVFGFDGGLEVLAITIGKGFLGTNEVLIVYRSTEITFYIQAAEITAEFCDEAIDLIRRDGSAHIFWSG